MRDGTGRRVEGNQHPDPRAEAVRWAICEAGLIQAIGRGRGVNRTADNPLQIDILTNVVPADRGRRGRRPGTAIQPTLAEIMRARGAVPLSYRDMAAAYPDLFPSAARAEKGAAIRRKPPTNSYREFLIGVCTRVSLCRLPPHRL